MPDHIISAMAMVADVELLLLLAASVLAGLLFGIVPGLSGLSALALLLPFVYGVDDAFLAIACLLGVHAAVYAGGSVTSILLGIPGSPANAATVVDGHALHLKGRGGAAIGAALFSSAAGGIFGAGVLMASMPLLEPVVLSFGAPEIFLIALLGITWAAALGQGPVLNALIAAALGLLLSTMGYQRITGVPRFWFDIDYLLDGLRLVPLVLGLFAVPEICSLARDRGGRADTSAGVDLRSMMDGVKSVLVRPLLFLRSALIGVFVGIVPGVGGETAPFMAHAAARIDRGPRGDATGFIEGVIAPESSNNAKEGGSLVPTLALGIPGSASMAMLLGAFLVVGLEPGPMFLASHMDMVAGLGLVLALTNVVAALLMVPLTLSAVRLLRLRGPVLAPFLTLLVVTGTYVSSGELLDVLFVFLFGALGMAMVRYDFSRPSLVLGFILGPIIETYFHIALRAYGSDIFSRPLAVSLMVLIAAALVVRLPFFRLFGTGRG